MRFVVSGSRPRTLPWPDVVVDLARSQYRGRWTWAVCDGGFVCEPRPTPSSRRPWLLPEQPSPEGARSAALAQAIRAAKRWEGAGPVGVRAWRMDGHLLSIADEIPWRQPMRARCQSRGDLHPAPAEGCYCGLYAVRPEAARALDRATRAFEPIAIGVVSLYGRVMSHRHGWRAQYARIREVWWLAEPDGPTPRTDLYPGVTWHRVEAW